MAAKTKKAAPKTAAKKTKKAPAKKPAAKTSRKPASKKGASKAKKAAPKKATAPKRVRASGAKGGGHREKVNFSESDVRYIRTRCYLRERGEKVPGTSNDISQAKLAEKFKCSARSIYAVATKRTYTEVADVPASQAVAPTPSPVAEE